MAETVKKIETGLVTINFINPKNEQVPLTFNPNDILLRKRFNEWHQKADEKKAEYSAKESELEKRLKETSDETEEAAIVGQLMDLEIEACDFSESEIDRVFGEGTSAKIFAGYKDLVSYYSFTEIVAPYIESSNKAIMERHQKPKNRQQRRAQPAKK